jgi:hypothetical protein
VGDERAALGHAVAHGEGEVYTAEELLVIGNFACTFFGKGKWTFFRKVKCTS